MIAYTGVPTSEENVCRFQVAMDDAALVGIVHCSGQQFDETRGGTRRLGLAVDPLFQAASLDEFEGKIGAAFVLADIVDLHDVGVLQARCGLSFREKSFAIVGSRVRPGQDHFEGDQPFETDLHRLVDDTHAAAAQFIEDFIAGQHERIRCTACSIPQS
jgi:hypothetical protein